jgi:hypothetical protein
MVSATRSALAMMVSVGFTAVAETKKLESATYTLSKSCSLQSTSSAEVVGSAPNRTVPLVGYATDAEPATRILPVFVDFVAAAHGVEQVHEFSRNRWWASRFVGV